MDGVASPRSCDSWYEWECCWDKISQRRPAKFEIGDFRYKKTITAKITGRETASRDGIAIGHIRATLVKETVFEHQRKCHKSAVSALNFE
jgi:hypothetical protein